MALTKVTGQVIKNTTDVTVGVLTVTNTLAVGGTVSIGGTLTYEDVTNVDAVGLITARNGIVVGSGITLSKDGDIFATGISTFKNTNVGGTPPWTIATGDYRSISISGTTANSSGFLKLGNGTATTNADFDLARIQIYNGATEVARITGETGDSNNDSGQIMFDTKENGGSLTERLIISREGHLFPSADSTYDIGSNSVRFRNFYADTLYGDGSNLTGISGLSVANQADNRLITCTGSTDALNGEQYLTYSSQSSLNNTDGNGTSYLGGNYLSLKRSTGTTNYLIAPLADGELYISADEAIRFATVHTADFNSTERLRIDSSGRVLVGHTASLSESTRFQVVDTSDNTAEFFAYAASTSGARLTLTKSRSGTKGTNTVVQSGDKLGEIHFRGADGSSYIRGATIQAEVDGTPGTNDMPGRLIFSTTGDGNNTQSERMRIKSTGQVGFNCTPDGSDFTTALVQMKFGTNRHFRFSYGHDSLPSIESRQDAGAYNGMRIAVDNIRIKCGTSPSDRFIITNDGTSGHLADNYNLGFYSDQGASGSYWFMRGSHSAGGNYGGGTDVYFVRTNGNVQNANNSYGQSSDIKLKENVVDASSQWDDIKNLKVRKFNFKAETGFETHTQIGLIAQETELVSAGLVEDVNDTSSDSEGKITETGTVTKHIKYSVLYMKSVKALQEAQTRIETLESKVAALEG